MSSTNPRVVYHKLKGGAEEDNNQSKSKPVTQAISIKTPPMKSLPTFKAPPPYKGFMINLGLEAYIPTLIKEDFETWDDLLGVGREDLLEIGFTRGKARKLLNAIQARSKGSTTPGTPAGGLRTVSGSPRYQDFLGVGSAVSQRGKFMGRNHGYSVEQGRNHGYSVGNQKQTYRDRFSVLSAGYGNSQVLAGTVTAGTVILPNFDAVRSGRSGDLERKSIRPSGFHQGRGRFISKYRKSVKPDLIAEDHSMTPALKLAKSVNSRFYGEAQAQEIEEESAVNNALWAAVSSMIWLFCKCGTTVFIDLAKKKNRTEEQILNSEPGELGFNLFEVVIVATGLSSIVLIPFSGKCSMDHLAIASDWAWASFLNGPYNVLGLVKYEFVTGTVGKTINNVALLMNLISDKCRGKALNGTMVGSIMSIIIFAAVFNYEGFLTLSLSGGFFIALIMTLVQYSAKVINAAAIEDKQAKYVDTNIWLLMSITGIMTTIVMIIGYFILRAIGYYSHAIGFGWNVWAWTVVAVNVPLGPADYMVVKYASSMTLQILGCVSVAIIFLIGALFLKEPNEPLQWIAIIGLLNATMSFSLAKREIQRMHALEEEIVGEHLPQGADGSKPTDHTTLIERGMMSTMLFAQRSAAARESTLGQLPQAGYSQWHDSNEEGSTGIPEGATGIPMMDMRSKGNNGGNDLKESLLHSGQV